LTELHFVQGGGVKKLKKSKIKWGEEKLRLLGEDQVGTLAAGDDGGAGGAGDVKVIEGFLQGCACGGGKNEWSTRKGNKWGQAVPGGGRTPRWDGLEEKRL